MNRLYDDALAPAELRTTQYSILARLHAEGTTTVGGLAERLGMDRTTLSRELAPLGVVAAGTAATLAHGTGLCQRHDVDRLLQHVSVHVLVVA